MGLGAQMDDGRRSGACRCRPRDAPRHRPAEPGHPVEHRAADLGFGPLAGQSPGAQTPTDDGLARSEEHTSAFPIPGNVRRAGGALGPKWALVHKWMMGPGAAPAAVVHAMRRDTGLPSRAIRLSTEQPTLASVLWPGRVRARRLRPMMALRDRKSTRLPSQFRATLDGPVGPWGQNGPWCTNG